MSFNSASRVARSCGLVVLSIKRRAAAGSFVAHRRKTVRIVCARAAGSVMSPASLMATVG